LEHNYLLILLFSIMNSTSAKTVAARFGYEDSHPKAAASDEPLRSVHTQNFANILDQLNISLVVSTYQAGKLVVLRADGDQLNTHFRVFPKPMGIAVNRHKLALGCNDRIWSLRNVPAAAAKLQPTGKHDACYLPQRCHITGNINIHELEWGGQGAVPRMNSGACTRRQNDSELWFVNTNFSCLCTLDQEYSFVPQWRPNFVTALTPEDRCHLNGLAMVNHQPKYVTALGESNTTGGWRENKAYGGILIDVENDEIIARGLSMPHSPRWYNNQLWVLESGLGNISVCDVNTGKLQTLSTLPGFTRGIDFCGSLAFIGLSQVRETAVFSGIPLTEKLNERICGVWVVNLETGKTIAFLKFEDAVQEIFAVKVLPDIRFPEIIDWDEQLVGSSFVLPDEALVDVPRERLF
jgi:uncharacterized protein (TIGR03032 family)